MTRNRAIEFLLLVLALIPFALIAVTAWHIWILGQSKDLWYAPAWGLVLLQLAALFAFSAHVLFNKSIAQEERSDWLLRIVAFQQVSMLGYWVKHVWGAPSNLRP